MSQQSELLAVDLESIKQEALQLAPADREKLASTLLESLEIASSDDLEILWAEEVERRAEDLRLGKVMPISGEDVMQLARALHK